MGAAALRLTVARQPAPACLVAVVGLAATVLGTTVLVATALAAASYHVSQRGRAFLPGTLQIRAGEAVEFMNDDGDLLHHAYLENDAFSFDTGDQEPGSRTSVTFPKTGSYVVMCGIHPKMKLVVQVQ